jgi:hypothetical protein
VTTVYFGHTLCYYFLIGYAICGPGLQRKPIPAAADVWGKKMKGQILQNSIFIA